MPVVELIPIGTASPRGWASRVPGDRPRVGKPTEHHGMAACEPDLPRDAGRLDRQRVGLGTVAPRHHLTQPLPCKAFQGVGIAVEDVGWGVARSRIPVAIALTST